MSVATPDAGRSAGLRVLITGGAGFIGTNVADRLLNDGAAVRILDSLSRRGTDSNLSWLRAQHPARLDALIGDIRDAALVREAVQGVDHVVHLAAQVAVTSSLVDPRLDFDVNALGTLNVLEAIRHSERPPSLVFCSTNKVYGALGDLEFVQHGRRYEPRSQSLRRRGVSEARPLDFHSPYGCSKGAADQYVLDYARSFGLRSAVLRMSCIYGPHQHGNEDQGWVAHFLRCALEDRPVTIYGDGRQVRDVLFVRDLVNALECARAHIDAISGRAFNIGGGPDNTLSILELLDWIADSSGLSLQPCFEAWRVGDQKYYVSDIASFRGATGWSPQTGVHDGLAQLHAWLSDDTLQLDEVYSLLVSRAEPKSSLQRWPG